MVLEEREEMDKELANKEQEQKNRELNKWLEDWEEHKSKDRELERSSLVAILGKPGSSSPKKREQESTKKPGRSKKLRYQSLASDWGETAPPPLAGVEILEVNEPRIVELVEDISPPSLGNANTPLDASRVTILSTTQTPVPDTSTTTPPRTILDETRLKQPSISSFLLPNPTEEVYNFDEPTPTTPLIQEVTVDGLPCSNAGGIQGTDVGTPASRSMSSSSPIKPSLVEPCSFKRGGMCIIHKKVGIKSIKQTRSWKKKKDGSFGYITSKKVSYSCESNELRKLLTPSCIISETDGGPNNGSNSDDVLGLSSDLEVETKDRNKSESLPPD